MKNVRTFIYKLLALSCWLMAMGMLPATAQQKQDALYIFRNDGQFNAFFWVKITVFIILEVGCIFLGELCLCLCTFRIVVPL